jgi:hypothetical protein
MQLNKLTNRAESIFSTVRRVSTRLASSSAPKSEQRRDEIARLFIRVDLTQ